MVSPILVLRLLLAPIWRLCGAGYQYAVVPFLLAAALGHAPTAGSSAQQIEAFQALTVVLGDAPQQAAMGEHPAPSQTRLVGFDPASVPENEDDTARKSGEGEDSEEDPEAHAVGDVRRQRIDDGLGAANRALKAFAHADSRPLLDWLHEQRAPRGPPVLG